MQFLKTVFAVLFSISLIATQNVFIAHAELSASEQNCKCCSCKEMDCCVAQPTSAPQQPLPTQTTRAVSPTQIQIIAAVVSILVQAPITFSEKQFPASCSASHSPDVPLFVRNCS